MAVPAIPKARQSQIALAFRRGRSAMRDKMASLKGVDSFDVSLRVRNPYADSRGMMPGTLASVQAALWHAFAAGVDRERGKIGDASTMLRNARYLMARSVEIANKAVERNPKSARRFRRMPVARKKRVTAARAKMLKMMSRFANTENVSTKKLASPRPFGVGFRLGTVLTIVYEVGRGDRRAHKFRPSSAPQLIASSDGVRLALIGGKYRFTERGIVDR